MVYQALQKFYELVLQAILRHIRFDGKSFLHVCVCMFVRVCVCVCLYGCVLVCVTAASCVDVVCFHFIISLLP